MWTPTLQVPINNREYYYLSDTNLCPVIQIQKKITISELVRKNMDVDEHERLENFIFSELVRKDIWMQINMRDQKTLYFVHKLR